MNEVRGFCPSSPPDSTSSTLLTPHAQAESGGKRGLLLLTPPLHFLHSQRKLWVETHLLLEWSPAEPETEFSAAVEGNRRPLLTIECNSSSRLLVAAEKSKVTLHRGHEVLLDLISVQCRTEMLGMGNSWFREETEEVLRDALVWRI